MTYKSSEAAPQGRLTQEPETPLTVLMPPVYHGDERSVKLATASDVEQFLSQLWGEPASIVSGYIGGHGYAPYARSETYYVPLDQDASGFTVLMHRQQVDR